MFTWPCPGNQGRIPSTVSSTINSKYNYMVASGNSMEYSSSVREIRCRNGLVNRAKFMKILMGCYNSPMGLKQKIAVQNSSRKIGIFKPKLLFSDSAWLVCTVSVRVLSCANYGGTFRPLLFSLAPVLSFQCAYLYAHPTVRFVTAHFLPVKYPTC